MRRSRRRAALLLLLGLPRARTRGTGGCPVHKTSGHMVQCSGHGDCNADNACACWPDWTGAACSERACPSATAWAESPINGIAEGLGAAEAALFEETALPLGNQANRVQHFG